MRARLSWVLVAAALGAASCGAPPGPRPIRLGEACEACGMGIQDLRFACERRSGRQFRVYDSIECLLRDGGAAAADPVWLADYDRRTLHAAESLWVVQGDFPSPMGGGLAAFLDRATADTVAARTRGRVDRLAGHAAPGAAGGGP